jgi:hypothetical protein
MDRGEPNRLLRSGLSGHQRSRTHGASFPSHPWRQLRRDVYVTSRDRGDCRETRKPYVTRMDGQNHGRDQSRLPFSAPNASKRRHSHGEFGMFAEIAPDLVSDMNRKYAGAPLGCRLLDVIATSYDARAASRGRVPARAVRSGSPLCPRRKSVGDAPMNLLKARLNDGSDS